MTERRAKKRLIDAGLVEEIIVVLLKEDNTKAGLQLEVYHGSRKKEETSSVTQKKVQENDKEDNGYEYVKNPRFCKSSKHNIILGNADSLQYCLTQLLLLSPSSLGISTDRPKSILFGLIQPLKYAIDFISNNIQTMLVTEKIELEHSLNWLSTLGGAFSALGENDQKFALKAGKVSKSQLYIAVRLGSPIIMSRCRLYAAISLIQLGKLRDARIILQREYMYAKTILAEADPRILRMCIGIWCKLQYEWAQTKRLKKISN